MTSPAHGTHGSAGFTLLELVIAIAVAGLILVGLSAGLRFDLRALRSEDRHIASYGEIAAAEGTLRRLLAEAHGFSGSADRLSLIGALPSALDRPGLFDVRLGLDGGGKLTLSWMLHHPSPAQGDNAKGGSAAGNNAKSDSDADDGESGSTALLDRVSGLELAYYTQGPAKVEGWQTATVKDVPPKLLRIRVRLSPEDPRRWLDLIVRPWVGNAAPKLGQP